MRRIARSNHLIPFFRDHKLSEITFEEVERYVPLAEVHLRLAHGRGRGEPAYTMRQIGHSKAAFTLEVYTHVNSRREAGSGPIGSMLQASEVAHNDANGPSEEIEAPRAEEAEEPNPAR